jgi:hypothetical protein
MNNEGKEKQIQERGSSLCRLCGIVGGTITAHCDFSCGSEWHQICKRGWQAR